MPRHDPYEVLGVHSDASVEDIIRAYRRLAREWHPDVSDDPAAPEHFRVLSRAYEQLLAAAEAHGRAVPVPIQIRRVPVGEPLVAGPVHVAPRSNGREPRDG